MSKLKLILIGGTARSGKTTLRKLMYDKHKIQGYDLDLIRRIIERKDTEYSESIFVGSDKYDKFKPYLNSFVTQLQKFEEGIYIIEGDSIRPETTEGISENDSLIKIFFGYTQTNSQEKFEQLKKLGEKSWTAKFNDEELRDFIHRSIEKSIILEKQCKEQNLIYIDTSEDLQSELKKAEKLILDFLKK